MDVKRDVVVALLEKLGAPHTTRISMDRAVQKLKRYVGKHGMPTTLTVVEKAVVDAVFSAKSAPALASTKEKKAPKPKAEKAAKTAKVPVVDWMTSSARAIQKSQTVKEAEEKALKIYLDNGGRKVTNVENNAKNNVSRALRVLVAYKIVTVDDSGKITV